MRFSSLLVAVAATTVPAQAFIAWSGDACDGDIGNMVPCDGSCHSFAGRHSFWAQASQDQPACVAMYAGTGCTGQRFNFSNQVYLQCTNVNTGTNIQSFRCWNGICR
ncbi:hypothetical protein AURDEDRAFT_176261 [Auricularia subglabra TFB-10046 SS5]|uniref:Uncharacterized protein n=1 Tax=Auricularia subglabra (strain TFB-10046 / SS5) TaxID=717982 RepID=J0D6X6_AURST|nr:hypothetical protein AURDEDRAFT_176261 [Auricularia subglabra TFB-10046 SS5]